jgi:hypothetical protein
VLQSTAAIPAILAEPQQRPETDDRAFRDTFTQLRTGTGHDFTNYKRTMVLRRIARRITVHGLPDLPAYAKLPQELRLELRTALYRAAQKRQQIDARGLELQMDGRRERINISVRPVLAREIAKEQPKRKGKPDAG